MRFYPFFFSFIFFIEMRDQTGLCGLCYCCHEGGGRNRYPQTTPFYQGHIGLSTSARIKMFKLLFIIVRLRDMSTICFATEVNVTTFNTSKTLSSATSLKCTAWPFKPLPQVSAARSSKSASIFNCLTAKEERRNCTRQLGQTTALVTASTSSSTS